MSIKKIITGLTLLLLLSSEVAIAADLDKGFKAFQSGDFKTALAEWSRLAAQGHANAQNNLGAMYNHGSGVPKNYKTAVKWYTLAAKQGDAGAQNNLGLMYANGNGVPENDKTAVMWYTKAAKQGSANGQHHMGFMYATGSGVLTDNR